LEYTNISLDFKKIIMNFHSLKIMVDNLVNTFKCPDCSSTVSEQAVEIMWTAGLNINIDIECPKCQKHSMIRAQMLSLELPIKDIQMKEEEINSKKIEELQKKLEEIEKFKGHVEDMKSNKENDVLIKDSEIIELNKNLKSNNVSMSELFGE